MPLADRHRKRPERLLGSLVPWLVDHRATNRGRATLDHIEPVGTGVAS